jgi:hypothetical protein
VDDLSDADCNAANSASVVAAMHGMAALPVAKVLALKDRVRGDTMDPLKMTPPVDESISALGDWTATMGEKVLLDHGTKLVGRHLIITTEQTVPQTPEIFKLSDLTTFWTRIGPLERADSEARTASSLESGEIRT